MNLFVLSLAVALSVGRPVPQQIPAVPIAVILDRAALPGCRNAVDLRLDQLVLLSVPDSCADQACWYEAHPQRCQIARGIDPACLAGAAPELGLSKMAALSALRMRSENDTETGHDICFNHYHGNGQRVVVVALADPAGGMHITGTAAAFVTIDPRPGHLLRMEFLPPGLGTTEARAALPTQTWGAVKAIWR